MSDVVGGVVSAAGGTVDQVAGAASGAVETATTPVTQATGGAVDTATGAATGAVDTATHVAQNAAPAPVTEAATGAVETVTHQVTQAAPSTVTETVDTVAKSVTQGSTSTAAQAAAPATDAATGSPGSGGGPGDSITQKAVDNAMSTAAGPGQAVRDAATTGTDSLTSAAAHPGAAADPVVASSAAPSGSSATLVAADPTLAAPTAGHDSVLHTMAEISPAARVVVTAAVISSVVGASAAAGEKGGMRRLAFVNAQLIPCLFKASVQQHLETISTALARTGAGADVAGSKTAASGDTADSPPRVQRLLEEIAQGFNDVVDGVFPDVVTGGDGRSELRDARLMTQIGMVFGLVYVGFLTVWFWATRRHQEDGI